MVKFTINKKKIIHLLFFYFMIFVFIKGCHQGIIIPDSNNNNNEIEDILDVNINSFLTVKEDSNIIKDCTPEFIVITEKKDVNFMSFSGDGYDWSEWVEYTENYDQFNIANGLCGTTMTSGSKTIYIRFKDINGNIFPEELQKPICCTFEYEIQKLFSIKIIPNQVELQGGESHVFFIKGYDLYLNEVPLDGQKVEWSKPCGIGELNPTKGLKTIYTAPDLPGSVKNISAKYGLLGSGAKVYIK